MRYQPCMILAGILLSTGITIAQVPNNGANLPGQAGDQGFYTDPNTGVTFRKVFRTVDQPVLDQQTTTQQRTTTYPEIVTTMKQEQRTVFVPVTRHEWQAKWHGVWNPFVQPSLAYHHVPKTTWEPRVETVQVPVTETKWLQKTETVQVPQNSLRIEKRQEVVWEPVQAPVSPASRMRPLGPTMPDLQNLQTPTSQIAAAGPSFYADAPGRSPMQQGIRPTVLGDSSNPGTIATMPSANMYR